VNAYQVYRQTQTQTAAPGELVLMLYRGAVRFLSAAIDAIEARNVPEAHDKLLKAQAIVSNLLESLDVERGGDVARNLSALYEYMLRRLRSVPPGTSARRDPGQADPAAVTTGQLTAAYAQLVINPDTHDVVIRVRDSATDAIIREYPSREVEHMAKFLKDYVDTAARRRAAGRTEKS
jgi:flagellar protein FliS